MQSSRSCSLVRSHIELCKAAIKLGLPHASVLTLKEELAAYRAQCSAGTTPPTQSRPACRQVSSTRISRHFTRMARSLEDDSRSESRPRLVPRHSRGAPLLMPTSRAA